MEQLKEAFEILSKGVILSQNSKKYSEVVNFLAIDENFEKLSSLVSQLGFELIGENGYFYFVKESTMTPTEVQLFVESHKKVIVAIAILKQIIPLLSPNDTIKITDFTAELTKRVDESLEQKLYFLFGELDTKTKIEEFFKLLEKRAILERVNAKDKDSFRVMQSINYYLKIVESVG